MQIVLRISLHFHKTQYFRSVLATKWVSTEGKEQFTYLIGLKIVLL